MSMEQIIKWREQKNKISDHKISIGALKEEIGLLKEEISICDNICRETPYYWVRQWVNGNIPELHRSFEDSISQGQVDSKIWMINELKKISLKEYEPLKIDIIGSWFGFPMIELLSQLYKIDQIDLYDLDENCHKVVAQYLNHFDLNFKVVQFGDFFERKDLRRRHLVINTSSEHMNNIFESKKYYKNYPDTPLLVLQSNNFDTLDEHINCVKSEDELASKNYVGRIYYKGVQSLPLYDRYMVIGRW